MRQALNDNPKVQMSVIGAMLLVAAAFFMLRPSGAAEEGSETLSPAEAAEAGAVGGPPPAAATAATATAPPAPGTASPATGTAAPAPAAAAGAVTPEALIPGRGLPAPVINAWKAGDAVVILIVRNRGIDDRMVRQATSVLESRPGVAVFSTRAKNVARYSRITQGVGVSRVPALVVVRPRSVSDTVPQATVSYGFRGSASAVQAVRDALYEGKDNLPYHPG